MIKPEVSIITPAYNSAEYITEAIKSALRQMEVRWEMIIINDGSTDNTKNIVKPYLKDERIRYYENRENIGVIKSSNKGIALSSGNLIARLDSDDVWMDDRKLKKQRDFLLKNSETVLVGSWGYKLDAKGNKSFRLQYPISNNEIKQYLLIEDCFLNSSVVFRKDKVLQVGGYDSRFQCAEDYALWLKLGQIGAFYNLPEYMVGYRTNKNGISMTRYNKQVTNTIRAIHAYHKTYPFYFLSLPLWYSRKVIPRKLRENISSSLRKLIVN